MTYAFVSHGGLDASGAPGASFRVAGRHAQSSLGWSGRLVMSVLNDFQRGHPVWRYGSIRLAGVKVSYMPAQTAAVLLSARPYLQSATRSCHGDEETTDSARQTADSACVSARRCGVLCGVEPMETLLLIWADSHPGAWNYKLCVSASVGMSGGGFEWLI